MTGSPGPPGVNVCFHGVGEPRRELESGEGGYWVGRDQFTKILDDLVSWPGVHISVDDGNASDVDIVLPALMERGLRAQFFVLAGRLDRPGSLGVQDVSELSRHGMAIGTHGMFHRPWPDTGEGERRTELVDARVRLSEIVGAPVDEAACPLGRYDWHILTQLRRLGYQRVHTSDRRIARRDAWLQPRFSVRFDDNVDLLRKRVHARLRWPMRAGLSAAGAVKRWR